VNGLSLESHAARCAELFGVPAHVVRRTEYVTYAFAGVLEG
jgi:DNA mismatch repair protein MSH5